MDERVLWGLSAVLLMALLMEADPERLWALTQALVRGALEGLLKGVLLGFWLFKRWEWELLLPLATLLFAAVPLPLAVRPPARGGGPGLSAAGPAVLWPAALVAGAPAGRVPTAAHSAPGDPKLARRRPLRQLSELLFHRPRPAPFLAVVAVGTVKRFPEPGPR